jgi:hypothetical protein
VSRAARCWAPLAAVHHGMFVARGPSRWTPDLLAQRRQFDVAQVDCTRLFAAIEQDPDRERSVPVHDGTAVVFELRAAILSEWEKTKPRAWSHFSFTVIHLFSGVHRPRSSKDFFKAEKAYETDDSCHKENHDPENILHWLVIRTSFSATALARRSSRPSMYRRALATAASRVSEIPLPFLGDCAWIIDQRQPRGEIALRTVYSMPLCSMLVVFIAVL